MCDTCDNNKHKIFFLQLYTWDKVCMDLKSIHSLFIGTIPGQTSSFSELHNLKSFQDLLSKKLG
jgi:hypothetical protein